MRVRVTLDFDTDLAPGDPESTETLHSLCRSYLLAQYDGVPQSWPANGVEAFEMCLIETVTNDGLLAYDVDIDLVASHVEIVPSGVRCETCLGKGSWSDSGLKAINVPCDDCGGTGFR